MNTNEHESQTLTQDGSRYLSITEAARFLSVSRETVYKLIEDKSIALYRVSPRSPRISRSELEAYVKGTAE